ncbi:MAG: hypothetical protein V1717_00910, partial [Candidatus Micrarchaeota archaeon]
MFPLNPYKLGYAVLITIIIVFLSSSFAGQEPTSILAIFLVSYILAHFTFAWFKKLVFRKVVVFDSGGVLVTGDYFTEKIKPSKEMVSLVISLRRKYVTALLS